MRCLLPILLLVSCSKGPQADLPYISQARSLAAEWALVNEQASRGQLTETYVTTMRQSFRQQLGTTASALTKPDSTYGRQVQALLAEPPDAAPEKLRVHVAKLKHFEDSLESD